MGIKYEVCGVEVDQKTHNEYMEKTFKFADGTERNLQVVELWAKSKEFEENLPEVHKQANEYVKQVREELRGKSVVEHGEHTSIAEYFEDLRRVCNESFDERIRLDNEFKETESAVNAMREKYGHQYASTAMVEAGEVLRNGLANLEANHTKRVAEVRKNMQERLGQIFNATPDKLDSNTMALLNTGICTVEELANLAEMNNRNPVMLRIIQKQVDKLADEMAKHDKFKAGEVRGLSVSIGERAKGADNFLSVFDGLAEFGGVRLSRREYHVAEVFKKKFDEEFVKHVDLVKSMDVYAS